MIDTTQGINADETAIDGTCEGADWNKHYLYIGAALFCIAISLYYIFCEKIPLNNGFGWDGTIYAKFVEHFETDILTGKIDTYYIKRILPSILVALPARIFNIPVTPSYIINGFIVANILNIVIAVVFWLKTAAFLELSQGRTIAGFLMLFICFPVLKFHAYIPILTDSFAYSTSLMMLYFYLRKRTIGLAMLIFLTTFIWTSALYLGLLLLLFPCGSRIVLHDSITRKIPAAAVFVTVCVMVYTLFIKKIDNGLFGVITPLNHTLLPLSILLALCYVYWCGRCFADALDEGDVFRVHLSGIGWGTVVMGLSVIFTSILIQKIIAQLPGWSTSSFITGIAWCSVKQPLIFLVSGAVYYASGFLFMVMCLKACMRTARDFGFGYLLAIAFALILGLGTEPRTYINIFPFIVLTAVMSGPFDRLSGIQWLSLVGIQLIGSKVWLYIGASSEELMHVQEFPAQRLFMNIGTWMSDMSYLIHLCAGVAVSALLWYLYIRGKPGQPMNNPLG